MREQQTYWESSSRPLFIKSVWIESTDGGYRHFILDYDNQKRIGENSIGVRKVLRPTVSYEADESQCFSLQLIGLSKSCNPTEPLKPTNRSRLHTTSPIQKSFVDLLKRKASASRDDQTPSKRSSLYDISNQDTINCDDKLAERVLNWLDLAGKTTIVRPNPLLSNSTVLKKPTVTQRSKSSTRPATAVNKRPDSMKHITIIFNSEGIPVRYNRPVRFSDLFRSGYSASRKFASTMLPRNGKLMGNANSRKYPLPGSAAFDRASMDLNKVKSQDESGSKPISYESDYRSLISRQLIDSSCNQQEAKKQLHIFMPSLPKKTLTATDCDSSCLSTAFSDNCKIGN